MKRCPKCGELKEESAFTKHSARRDGLQPYCNSCQRAAVKDHYWRHRDYYLVKARKRNAVTYRQLYALVCGLKSVPCADCGGSYPPYAMQFDHIKGEKLFNVSDGIKRRSAGVLKETEKCEVVCANCHADRTQRRRTA